MNMIRTSLQILVLFAFVSIATGCAQIRLLTYPQSFTWLDGDDVRSVMHAMTSSMGKIDQLITTETFPGENQGLVLDELDNLELTAQTLLSAAPAGDAEDAVPATYPATNHLLIDEHLDEFTESVLLAQVQAQASPPNYYRAGQLTGSCTACHRFR